MITIYKTNSMKNAAQYVNDTIARASRDNLDTNFTVLVPDRATLEAERALLKAIYDAEPTQQVAGSFNAQVRSFRRLANEILDKYNYLSKQAGIMALAGIIQDNKENLQCFKKGVDTAGFVSDMYDTISMMKYCGIQPEDLENPNLDASVAGKARDVALLFRAYKQYTQGEDDGKEKYIDSADKMTKLLEKIVELCESEPASKTDREKADLIKNTHFFLYDFDNFSAQELAIVEKLALYARSVTVACCVGGERDKYLYLNDIYSGVLAMCRKNGIEPNIQPKATDTDKPKYGNLHTQQIGENLFRYGSPTAVDNNGFVEIFAGNTRVQEVYALACRIQRYVREGQQKGARFKDVYVVTSDISKYAHAIKTVFEGEFDIPTFCDTPFCLADHPYARFILDYLSVCQSNAKLSYVLPFVKNYLFCGNFADDVATCNDDVYHFENFCLKYNVSYDYAKLDIGQNDEHYAAAREFAKKFDKLYKTVRFDNDSKNPAETYINGVHALIEAANLNERNQRFAEKQQKAGLEYESKVTTQAQQKIEEVLAQAAAVLGSRPMKLEEFAKILTSAITSVNVSVIPVMNDCVVFANMAKARKHDIKFLALLGANQGAMPILKGDNKLLNDRNMAELNQKGISVEPLVSTENKRERFSLFQLLLEPSDHLYVSYAKNDGADELNPSPFVAEIEKLFVDNKLDEHGNVVKDKQGKPVMAPLEPAKTADEEAYTPKQAVSKVILNARRQKDKQPVRMPAFDVLAQHYKDKLEEYSYARNGNVTVNSGEQLYLKSGQTSVSKLTVFYHCPYQFYMKYGLGIQPRKVAELGSADLGNILHAVLELYVPTVQKGVEETDTETEEKAGQLFEAVLAEDDYSGIRNNQQLKGALKQLRKEALRICKEAKKQFANSQFENFRTELQFGGEKLCDTDTDAVKVDFDGGSIELMGKIDRVDVWNPSEPPQDDTEKQQNATAEQQNASAMIKSEAVLTEEQQETPQNGGKQPPKCDQNTKFVVIDYKSGSSAAKYGEKALYNGQKLQLLVYLMAMRNKYGCQPVGYYYFNVHDRFSDVNDEEDAIYNFAGRTLNDLDVAQALDTNFTEERGSKKFHLGRVVENKKTHEKRIYNTTAVLTDQQIENQIAYAELMIQQAGKLMQQGYANVSPYSGTCGYCDYKDVCDFGDVFVAPERDVTQNITKTTIDQVVNKWQQKNYPPKTK